MMTKHESHFSNANTTVHDLSYTHDTKGDLKWKKKKKTKN